MVKRIKPRAKKSRLKELIELGLPVPFDPGIDPPIEIYEAYVDSVTINKNDDTKVVTATGRSIVTPAKGTFSFTFPPNDLKFFSELMRAMTHPHLRVVIVTDPATGVITALSV